jgi:superoxide reductase
MDRRNFIKETLLLTAVLAASSGKAIAEEYGETGGKDINRLQNKENPSALEQKHVPGIEAPESVKAGSWFNVNIKVGFMQEHPSKPEHWITMIKLLINGEEVAKTDFKTGGISAPVARFRVRLDKTSTIEALEHCNIHGKWISDPVSIKVA